MMENRRVGTLRAMPAADHDRAPKGSDARKGAWFLYRQVAAGDGVSG